jgi:hypothetical protein
VTNLQADSDRRKDTAPVDAFQISEQIAGLLSRMKCWGYLGAAEGFHLREIAWSIETMT